MRIIMERALNEIRKIEDERELPRRVSTTGTVEFSWECRPCGHVMKHHDDHGCTWRLCNCSLPGERK